MNHDELCPDKNASDAIDCALCESLWRARQEERKRGFNEGVEVGSLSVLAAAMDSVNYHANDLSIGKEIVDRSIMTIRLLIE